MVIQSSWRDRHSTPPSPRSTCVTRVPLERGSLRSVLHAIAVSDAQRSSPSGKSCSAVGLSRRLQLPADYPMAAQMQRRYYLRVQIFCPSPCVARKHMARRGSRPAHSGEAEQLSRNTVTKFMTELGVEDISPCPVKTVLHRSIPPHPTRRISPGTASATVVSRRCGVLRLRRLERGRRQREIPRH